MLKKLSLVLTFIMVLGAVSSGFAAAAQKDAQDNIKSQVISSIMQSNKKAGSITPTQLSSMLADYLKNRLQSDSIVGSDVTVKDFTGDGKLDAGIISSSARGEKYLDIYTFSGKKAYRIFSGSGNAVKINKYSFDITNIGFDGRYYYETYTYRWSADYSRFLRVGYARTYIRGGNGGGYENPGRYDERIVTAKALLSARMKGNYELAAKYLSKSYREKLGIDGIASVIPYGTVTAVDIFESQRGDWVAVVMKDRWGQSRVFKFVPIQEKNQYGNYKIDNIIEIPEAR
ncbi:MAG TPA: hypothetical protein GXX35_01645 [Thermoanaerobacterales bacterium]|nr:hypothetical protein [Thermoanaerobacterales bacterium]